MERGKRAMNQSRWGKDFPKARATQRDLEETERRRIVTDGGKLSDDTLRRKLAADAGWRPPDLKRDLVTDLLILFFSAPTAGFLVGVLVGVAFTFFLMR